MRAEAFVKELEASNQASQVKLGELSAPAGSPAGVAVATTAHDWPPVGYGHWGQPQAPSLRPSPRPRSLRHPRMNSL